MMGSDLRYRDAVSIPNGDRHYLELPTAELMCCMVGVSIPNGDRHYLEQKLFMSEAGTVRVSIPNGDRHYLELSLLKCICALASSFNPQWG